MDKSETLRTPLTVFKLLGLWRPTWPSRWKIILYDFYTCLMITFVLSAAISEFVRLLTSLSDVKAFANKAFVYLTVIGIIGKATNILLKRKNIIELIFLIESYPCAPRDEEEVAIQKKYNQAIRLNTLRYAAITVAGISSIIFGNAFDEMPRRIVPYEGWLPFDHQKTLIRYCAAYFHQMGSHIVGAGVNVAFDTLLPGMMLETCGQLNILEHRLSRVPQRKNQSPDGNSKEKFDNDYEARSLAECVKHHLKIFKFAESANAIFSAMIFAQYSLSSSVLCFSIFELSKLKPFTPEFTSIFMYLGCMLMQIYVFCFYGCQVTAESLRILDSIYAMDWTSLSVSSRRSLLTIMARTAKPIQFKSGHVVSLNLESFNSLIKLSYSAYNFLQQTSIQ